MAHLPEAFRILEDGRIKAGLIGDESRLKNTRISVSWLSANTWAFGSIYGNIQFKLPWDELIADKRVYWVEAMIAYSPPAYRFLITDRDLSGSKSVTPYDPEHEKGPLRLRDDVWYWNDQKTSEFMLDCDIPLSQCTEIRFIDHHKYVCRVNGGSCPDRNRQSWTIGAQALAYVMARNLTRVRRCLIRDHAGATPTPGVTVTESLEALLSELDTEEPNGSIHSAQSSEAILRGALLLYGNGQFDDARDLVGLLGSKTILKNALEVIVRKYLKLPAFSLSG